MDFYKDIDIQDCPYCGGVGMLEEEGGRWWYVVCADCGSQTCEVEFNNEEEKIEAAKSVAHLWNIGKINKTGVGE